MNFSGSLQYLELCCNCNVGARTSVPPGIVTPLIVIVSEQSRVVL